MPRNIVNAAPVSPLEGEKLMFTVISILSEASTGVEVAARFTLVHSTELIVSGVVVVRLLTIPSLTTIIDICDISLPPSLMSKLLSAAAILAARTEYVCAPVAPGLSRYIKFATRLLPGTSDRTTCIPKIPTWLLLRKIVNLAALPVPVVTG